MASVQIRSDAWRFGSTPLVLLGLGVLLNLIMLWRLPILPMVDLPFHLAAASIHRHFHEDDLPFRTHFRIEKLFPQANALHLGLVSSATWMDVETANRVLISAYTVLLPLSMWLVIRHVGGNPWLALLSLTLLYNSNFAWGFAGFVLALPMVVLLWIAVLEFTSRPRLIHLSVIAVSLVLLFTTHVLAMLYAMLVLVACVLTSPLRKRLWLPALACILPAAVITATWWIGRGDGDDTLSFLVGYYRDEYLSTLWSLRKGFLLNDHRYVLDSPWGPGIGLMMSLAILLPIGLWMVLRRERLRELLNQPRSAGLFTVLGATACCVLFLPDRLPGQPGLFERFGVLLMLAGIAVGSITWGRDLPRLGIVGLLLLVLAYQALRVEYLLAWEKNSADFTRDLLPETNKDELLFPLIYQAHFRGLPLYTHFGNYQIIWNRRLVSTSLSQFRFGIVRSVPGKELPYYYDYTLQSDTYAPGHFDRATHLLVRGEIPDQRLVEGYEPQIISGAWSVYRRP